MNAFPEICEIVKAFGQRAEGLGVEDESWAGYYSRIKSDSPAPEGFLSSSVDTGNTGSHFSDTVRQQATVIPGPGMTPSLQAWC